MKSFFLRPFSLSLCLCLLSACSAFPLPARPTVVSLPPATRSPSPPPVTLAIPTPSHPIAPVSTALPTSPTPTALPPLALDSDEVVAWLEILANPRDRRHFAPAWRLGMNTAQDYAHWLQIDGQGNFTVLPSGWLRQQDQEEPQIVIQTTRSSETIYDPRTRTIIQEPYPDADSLPTWSSPDQRYTATLRLDGELGDLDRSWFVLKRLDNITHTTVVITHDLGLHRMDRPPTLHVYGTGAHGFYASISIKLLSDQYWQINPLLPNPFQPMVPDTFLHIAFNDSINPRHELLVYHSEILTTSEDLPQQLRIHDLATHHETVLDDGAHFYTPIVTHDGQRVFAMRQIKGQAPQLCSYALRRQAAPTCIPNVTLRYRYSEYTGGRWFNWVMPVEVTPYSWSPDHTLLLIDATDPPSLLIIQANTGRVVANIQVPYFIGSAKINNRGRVVMVAYKGEEAGLLVYDLAQQRYSPWFAIGRETPLIAYVP